MSNDRDTSPVPHPGGPPNDADWPTATPATATADPSDGQRTMAHVIYALYAIQFLTAGIGMLIGVILAHMQRRDTAGTWLESHFQWQIRSFWIGLAGYLVGSLLAILLVGLPILALIAIWMIYRIVVGWMALGRGEPIKDPERFI